MYFFVYTKCDYSVRETSFIFNNFAAKPANSESPLISTITKKGMEHLVFSNNSLKSDNIKNNVLLTCPVFFFSNL